MDKKKRTYFVIGFLLIVALYFIALDFAGNRNATDSRGNGDSTNPVQDQTKDNNSNSQKSVGLNVGEYAPSFSLEDMDGNIVNLEDYLGKVVMLNFWSIT